MSLTLEIVSSHGRTLAGRSVKTFGQDGGTIGRALESDWALPDGKRYLSARHASIDFRSGSYYIVDTSKNGVFVNDSYDPVGNGKPQRLFSGDRIRIGEYEMTVTIDDSDDTRESLYDLDHVDPVDLKERVEAPDPTGNDLLDAHVITGVGVEIGIEDDEALDDYELRYGYDFEQDLGLEGEADAGSGTGEAGTGAVTSIEERRLETNGSLQAFFRGAGMETPKVSRKQAERLMHRLGKLTREFITGTIECLHIRAIQRAQLKQLETDAQPRPENPLNYAVNFQEGFSRLLLDEADGAANPAEAVRAAFADITLHERILLNAVRDACDEYLERLDPETIERSIGNSRVGVLMGHNKHKYWEVYKDVYAVLGNRPADEMPQPFLEELAKAYERHLRKAEASPADAEGVMAG